MSGRAAAILLVLVIVLLVIVWISTGIHELRAGAIGFVAGVVVGRVAPIVWRWRRRRDR
jgi:hypothetical protein